MKTEDSHNPTDPRDRRFERKAARLGGGVSNQKAPSSGARAKKATSLALAGVLAFGMCPAPASALDAAELEAGTVASEALEAMQGGSGRPSASRFDYSGTYDGTLVANAAKVESAGKTITSTEKGKNAALALNGGELSITNGELVKSGDDNSGDACNFYGANAAALAVNSGSRLTIADSTISATSTGSNAVFATDSAEAFVRGTSISTTANSARGLDATYNGAVIADDVDISTKGAHCAALATDRGGGNVSATNSQLNTAGSGSPIIYSTGAIEVDNCTGTATGSQIACVEGLNNVLISDSQLKSLRKNGSSDSVNNGIMVYRSSSGDADTSKGERARLQVVDSTLSSALSDGAFFYFTNTRADCLVCNSQLNFDSSKALLAKVAGNSARNWGTPGSNGAGANITAISQELVGGIEVDKISTLDFSLLNGSRYEGAVNIVDNDAGKTSASARATVNVSEDSTWIVTGNSTITALNVKDGGRVIDSEGRSVSIVQAGSKVVNGDSPYTVSVTSYSLGFDTTTAQALSEPVVSRSAYDEWAGSSTAFSVFDEGADAKNVPISAADLEKDADENGTGSDSGGQGADPGGSGPSGETQPGNQGGVPGVRPGQGSGAPAMPGSDAGPAGAVSQGSQMHRLYNPYTGEHFYTKDPGEKGHLVQVGWSYEGVAWSAPASGAVVYRLYNPYVGDHHYTMSSYERDKLVSVGWRYEGVGWYSAASTGKPLYRLYNPNATTGMHHYTASTAERDFLVSLGWRAEGVGWYGA